MSKPKNILKNMMTLFFSSFSLALIIEIMIDAMKIKLTGNMINTITAPRIS